MKTLFRAVLALLCTFGAGFWSPACADPCGMVPPLLVNDLDAIRRVGDQQTYIFFKDGMQTMVLRPGFTGSIDEFGMLIPFPTPPSVRKVSDTVFEQLAAAVNPPPVKIYLGGFFGGFGGGGLGGGGGGGFGGMMSGMMSEDYVEVIREEAVGMYQVAVLEAGSTRALEGWMKEHQYVFPRGMEAVCPDYIRDGWCFLAVKTKVKRKAASDPQPGQRFIDNGLLEGESFDGYMQAMGFRFLTPKAVVPMRLSVFNSDDLNNLVYLLTEKPSTFEQLPKRMVEEQISGKKLFRNLTDPLPLEIIGGTVRDLTQNERRGLTADRDPRPKNGVAAELFAEDLIATQTRELINRREIEEIALLAISEELNLRGPEVDEAISDQLQRDKRRVTRAALAAVKEMTLTVVRGDFPRDVIAAENLTLVEYRSPKLRRDTLGAVHHSESPTMLASAQPDSPVSAPLRTAMLLLVAAGCVALIHRGRAQIAFLVVLLWVSGWACQQTFADEPLPAIHRLVKQLAEPETAPQAIDQLVRHGSAAVPALIAQSKSRHSLITRGWAIIGLGRVADDAALDRLQELMMQSKEKELVRIWAAAARVNAARDESELAQAANAVLEFPAADRVVGLKYRELRAGKTQATTYKELEETRRRLPQLERFLQEEIRNLDPSSLVEATLTDTDSDSRLAAAGYLASLGTGERNQIVAESFIEAMAFSAQLDQPPWRGGPLYVPGIQWDQAHARQLLNELLLWLGWAHQHGDINACQQLLNSLQSVSLIQAAGYPYPQDQSLEGWLTCRETWKAE